MISKRIHFIWLSKKNKPKSFELAYSGVKKYANDYEVKIWDEENIKEESFYKNLPKYYFVLMSKKRFAFASDILRFFILEKYGGIYFDIDQVLIKNIDDLLDNKMFISKYHEVDNYYGFGLLGVTQDHNFIKSITDFYKNYNKKEFIIVNKIGSEIINNILEKNKEDKSINILSQDYFYPLTESHYTENTRSYHIANTSWIPLYKKILFKIPFYLQIKSIIKNLLPKNIKSKIFKTDYL